MLWNRKYMYDTFYHDTFDNIKSMDCVRFVKSDKELMKIWRKSECLWDFIKTVREDDLLKWSDFALYWYGHGRPDWYYRREYCGKFASRLFKTTSDIGAVKIGVDGMELLVGNYYGDGINRVAVFDRPSPYVSWLFPHGGNHIRGKELKVYSYDCGNEVACTLSGAYAIYADDRFIALVKYAD